MAEHTASTGPKSLRDELGGKPVRAARNTYSEQERKERQNKMASAQALAMSVLKQRHLDEYQTLYQRAKHEVGL